MPDPTPLEALEVRQADLENLHDQRAIVELTNYYASRLIGRRTALPAEVAERLLPGLRAHPMTRVFLAWVPSLSGGVGEHEAIGLATCFVGFSTFRAKPLINVHDLAVHAAYRGRGVGGALLDAVEDFARQSGCCAVTLEVQANNPARRLYARKGYRDLEPPVHDACTLFAKKDLSGDVAEARPGVGDA